MHSLPVFVVKIARDGEDIGDFSWSEIRSLVASGSILPTDHYWYEGMAEWRLVGEQWATSSDVSDEELQRSGCPPAQTIEEKDTAKLTPCPSCEREISPKARACPHCGRPLRGFRMQQFAVRMQQASRENQQKEEERRERQKDIKKYLSDPATVLRVLFLTGGLIVAILCAIYYAPLFGIPWLMLFILGYAFGRNGEEPETPQHCASISAPTSFIVAAVWYFWIGPFLYPSMFPHSAQSRAERARAEGEAILEDMERYNANPRGTQAEWQAIEKRAGEFKKKYE